MTQKTVAIIGAGAAGLMAAERLAMAGLAVTLYERMPSPARKFLLAGRGGLNITHSEPLELFLNRYGPASAWLAPLLARFSPEDLRQWCAGLGEDSFIGSSGRVFPRSFKATPLLRAWLRRLDALGVTLKTRHEWRGWDESGHLHFMTPQGAASVTADATILALGGASWPRLGSDGGWTRHFSERGIPVLPLRPANCGFHVAWSDIFKARFAGEPLKNIRLRHAGWDIRGEAMITQAGIEGGAVYALSRPLRESLDSKGKATLFVDLHPDLSLEALEKRLNAQSKSTSLGNRLRKAGLSQVATSLLREPGPLPDTTRALALLIKNMPLALGDPMPIERAISTAGGIDLSALDDHLMLRDRPGCFVAGEMLDWEAPTGGYLLQACFSTAVMAADGVIGYLNQAA